MSDDWWSRPDGEAAAEPPAADDAAEAQGEEASSVEALPAAEPGPRTCPWCSAPAGEDDTTCRKCGASLAQRESLAGLAIPGVTALDPSVTEKPALETLIDEQSAMNRAVAGMMFPLGRGLSPLGAASVFAPEIAGAVMNLAGYHDGAPQEGVPGVPSEAALLAARRLDAEEHGKTLDVAAGTDDVAPDAAPPRVSRPVSPTLEHILNDIEGKPANREEPASREADQ